MFAIAWKFIKQQTRTFEFFIIQMCLPLIIIVLLGFILNDAFETNDISISGTIAYQGTEQDIAILDQTGMDFTFVPVSSKAAGIRMLEDAEVQAFLDFTEKGKTALYHPKDGSFASSISELVMRTEDSYKALYSIDRLKGLPVPELEEIPVLGLNPQIKPRAIDYYGVTMLFMFLLFSAYAAAYGIILERSEGTLNRILVSPRNAGSFYSGLSLGSLAVILTPALVVLTVGSLLLKINYGSNWLVWSGLLLSAALLAMGIGFFFGTHIKKNAITDASINIIIQVWAFLGGGFVMFSSNDIFSTLGVVSPLYWLYKAAFEAIYTGSTVYLAGGMLIPAGIGCLLILLSGIRFTKGALQ